MKNGLKGPARTKSDKDALSARNFMPGRLTLPSLRKAAASCTGCELYRNATQTVFGEGQVPASLMFVGEQPGDQEDLEGRPFVGPAGRLLDRALAEVRISREKVYVTNVVKHFKWQARGKRRIHEKPRAGEIEACRPWLDAEISLVKPRLIVCLGATAARAFMGPKFRVSQSRGQVFRSSLPFLLMATVHPSSLLRIPDSAERQQAYADFLRDLREARRELELSR